jgi:predicted regulator of Ras-like GTPase activity (Roadblock/LC7/MglB family)
MIHRLPRAYKEGTLSFTDSLAQIIDRIEGCAAVVILGIDGIPIERQVRDLNESLDIDLIATEFTTLVRRSIRMASDTELGELREMTFATDLMTFLLRPITQEYFLLMALNPGGNIGRARYELRKAQLAMETEFAI